MLGADEAGQAVYLCPTFAPIDESAYICRIAPCDFNGDGVADVRDLVRMVRCITKADTCDTSLVKTFDCDGSGTFDIDDVICCAMAILREGPHPPGQDDRPANLRVSMGEPETVAGALEIPVEVTGDTPVGAARLSLRLPASAFESVTVVAEPGASWLAVHDVQSDQVTVGMIALGTGGTPQTPLRFTLRLEPLPGTTPSGQVSLAGADFAAPDGARLLTDPGSPSVTFGAGAHLDLSAAEPNPFRDAMRFSVVVPRAADVEVGIFDLVGRRLATLHRGPLESGAHVFTWSGRTDEGTRAPSGVYFYHVRSNGHVLARRAVFLGGTAGP
jgi:FlgD Ig-like domain